MSQITVHSDVLQKRCHAYRCSLSRLSRRARRSSRAQLRRPPPSRFRPSASPARSLRGQSEHSVSEGMRHVTHTAFPKTYRHVILYATVCWYKTGRSFSPVIISFRVRKMSSVTGICWGFFYSSDSCTSLPAHKELKSNRKIMVNYFMRFRCVTRSPTSTLNERTQMNDNFRLHRALTQQMDRNRSCHHPQWYKKYSRHSPVYSCYI